MTAVLTAVFAVFTAVGDWIGTAFESLIPMFYTEAGLTFLGVLAVASLGFSVVFLLINKIGDFLQFRG